MTLRTILALRHPMLDALGAMLDGATLWIRTGAQPALATDAATGTLLWTKVLPADAFAPAVGGVITKLGTWAANPIANGLAGWFRIVGTFGGNVTGVDGRVTLVGNGGEMTVNDLNFVTTQAVEVITCRFAL